MIEETLRLSEVASGNSRVAKVDTRILGYAIPKGTVVWTSNQGPSITTPAMDLTAWEKQGQRSEGTLKAQQRVPAWRRGSGDLAEFHPERWLKRDVETGEQRFDANSGPSFPFSLGPRGCFGKRLAYMQLRIFAVRLVLALEFLTVPEKLAGFEAVQKLTCEPKFNYCRARVLKTVKQDRRNISGGEGVCEVEVF